MKKWSNMERVVSIVPNENDFNFRFTKDTCYKMKYGECPVLVLKNDITSENEKCKCVRLIKAIICEGFKESSRESWIEIIKDYETGIYEICNGMHRICAASKLNVPIVVHIYDE